MPPVVRPAAAVERELAQIEAQLEAQLGSQLGSQLDTQGNATRATGTSAAPPIARPQTPVTTRTPLGAPPPETEARDGATALIDPNAPPRAADAGLARTILALGGVVLVSVGLAWLFKKFARTSGGLSGSLGAGGRAPAGLIEVLARYPLASRHTLVVLRFDRRVLLCSMTGGSRHAGAGMSVLCELEEPEDVASILIKARDQTGESMARSFERSLRDAERVTEEAFTPSSVRPQPLRSQTVRPQVANPATGPSQPGPLRRGLSALRDGGRP
jgi:flagellar biogenesis protein FliO